MYSKKQFTLEIKTSQLVYFPMPIRIEALKGHRTADDKNIQVNKKH